VDRADLNAIGRVARQITVIGTEFERAAGTLALVVVWIPIVGQALAAVLGTVAVALAASILTLLSWRVSPSPSVRPRSAKPP